MLEEEEAGWLCDPNPKTRDGWEVLSDIKQVLKEDAGLDLNFDKTKIVVKGISRLMRTLQHST